MLHHTPLDWVHRLTTHTGDVSPHPILTGPKTDEKQTVKAGEVIRLGDSSLQIVSPDTKTELDDQTVKLAPNEYGYWTFLNLHRTDQPHVSLHLQSGVQRLLIEAVKP
jgi:hypothetical protein